MRLLAGLAAACCLHGAVIRGTVVEHQTGKLLARSAVLVQPIAGTPGGPLTMKTNLSGGFECTVSPGAYLIKATRPGFLPLEYGQKRWNSAGTPLYVDDNTPAYVAIRLQRWGAISGTVVDENDIGLPEQEVAAYRNSRPPQLVARVKSDERGIYRISGLEPGTYLVRTTGAEYEEGSYLPTFGRESIAVDGARTVEVDLDQQADHIDVRPLPGKLITVRGSVLTDPPGVPAKVTLATDISRQTVTTQAAFRFTAGSPGPFEVYAEAPAEDDPDVKLQGAYQSSSARTDISVGLVLSALSNLGFEIRGGPANDPGQVQARRVDLAGAGEIVPVKPNRGRAQLSPGRWEVRLIPPSGYYVASFSGNRSYRANRARPEAWNEIVVDAYAGYVRFALSSGGGSVTGVVRYSGNVAAGAPVYLEGWDSDTRQRAVEPRVTRTDAQGRYAFHDLPPGTYRVLSTFEYRNPDAAAMDLANAPSIQMEAHGAVQKDLELYVMQ